MHVGMKNPKYVPTKQRKYLHIHTAGTFYCDHDVPQPLEVSIVY